MNKKARTKINNNLNSFDEFNQDGNIIEWSNKFEQENEANLCLLTIHEQNEVCKAEFEFTFHKLSSISKNLNKETSRFKDIISMSKNHTTSHENKNIKLIEEMHQHRKMCLLSVNYVSSSSKNIDIKCVVCEELKSLETNV